MTAFTLESDDPSAQVPGIEHRCLRRKSLRIYELLDPKKPEDIVSFDVGQIKAIVDMDGRIRSNRVVTSVPAGYSEFAALYNEYTTGPERFSTLSYVRSKLQKHTTGNPIVWEHFLVDDSLVGRVVDPSSREPITLPSQPPPSRYRGMQPLPSESMGVGKAVTHLRALSAHMKGALETTDQLAQFWIKRGAIEHDYASRLAKLAERTIGEQEPSEFRDAIDGFRIEAARQAMNHNTLAMQIAIELESQCLNLQIDQAAHWREVYEPGIKKLEETLLQEGRPQPGISAEWKKQYRNIRHSLDLTRLKAMKGSFQPQFQLTPHSSIEHFESDPRHKGDPIWGSQARRSDWETLLDSCQKMETNRSQLMTTLLSAFTDVLASVRSSQDESHGLIIRTFDLFKPEDVLEEFRKKFSGNGGFQNFREATSEDISKNMEQGYSRTPIKLETPRPLPKPPALTAPISYLNISGKGKEKESLDPRDVFATSPPPDVKLRLGQVLGSHGMNLGKSAVPHGELVSGETLTGPRSRGTTINAPNPSPLPTVSRSISLTNKADRDGHPMFNARRHHERPHTPSTMTLSSTHALPLSRRIVRPTLPKINTRFAE